MRLATGRTNFSALSTGKGKNQMAFCNVSNGLGEISQRGPFQVVGEDFNFFVKLKCY